MIRDIADISDTVQYNRMEAAVMIGVSLSTLNNYTKAGNITCHRRRANGRPFYYGRDLKKFLKSEL